MYQRYFFICLSAEAGWGALPQPYRGRWLSALECEPRFHREIMADTGQERLVSAQALKHLKMVLKQMSRSD